MKKTMTFVRLDNKETKGCFRYGFEDGDEGVSTVYIRKSSLSGPAPKRLTVTLEGGRGGRK